MKKLYLIPFLIASLYCTAQNIKVGEYSNYFGSSLKLNSNFTFNYTWHFDLESSWTNGTWSISKDTIYLKTILVFDTLRFLNDQGYPLKDSLILSDNSNGQFKIVGSKTKAFMFSELSSGGQNRRTSPDKLFYKNKRLYGIDKNGKLIKKKNKDFWTNKYYNPWYFIRESK